MAGHLERRALLAGGGLALAGGGIFMAQPAEAAVTQTAKRVYYAADAGILPNAHLNSYTENGVNLLGGKRGELNVHKINESFTTPPEDLGPKINAFFDDIEAAGGGIAVFEGNNSNMNGYGIATPILLRGSVPVHGLGWIRSNFFLLDGANCSVFANHSNPNSQLNKTLLGMELRDVGIYGNRWAQSWGALNFSGAGVDRTHADHPANPSNAERSSHGIKLAGRAGDTYGLFENIYISNMYGSGVFADTTGGECRFNNIVTHMSGGNGFVLGNDIYVSNCTAATAEYDGFYQKGGSARYSNTKAFWCGIVFQRWEYNGNKGGPVRRPSSGYVLEKGEGSFAGVEAQNCGGSGFVIGGENTNGQLFASGNATIADPAANPGLKAPLPSTLVNDQAGSVSGTADPGLYSGVRIEWDAKYHNLQVSSRTASQQSIIGSGVVANVGAQIYALEITPVNGTGTQAVSNNISVTHSFGTYPDGANKTAVLTPTTHRSALDFNHVIGNGKELADALRKAPTTITDINQMGVYFTNGTETYTENPFPGGWSRIECTMIDGRIFLEATRLDATAAPKVNIKWGGSPWSGWTVRSRA